MSEELKPCPICRGDARRVDIPAEEDRDEFAGGSYIECSRCGLTTNVHFDCKENLTSSWNDRPQEDALAAENAALAATKREEPGK